MQSQVEANFGQQCSQASASQIWRWTHQALVLQGSVGAAACAPSKLAMHRESLSTFADLSITLRAASCPEGFVF